MRTSLSCLAVLPLLSLLSPAAGQAPSPVAIPVVWSTASGGNGHYYQAWHAPAGISWTAAQAIAVSPGGHLATISSAGENTFVYGVATGPGTAGMWQTLPPGGTYGPWLGGVLSGGVWGWISGEPFGFTNWDPGEPNDACPGQLRATGAFRGWNLGRNAPRR